MCTSYRLRNLYRYKVRYRLLPKLGLFYVIRRPLCSPGSLYPEKTRCGGKYWHLSFYTLSSQGKWSIVALQVQLSPFYVWKLMYLSLCSGLSIRRVKLKPLSCHASRLRWWVHGLKLLRQQSPFFNPQCSFCSLNYDQPRSWTGLLSY